MHEALPVYICLMFGEDYLNYAKKRNYYNMLNLTASMHILRFFKNIILKDPQSEIYLQI